MAVLSVRMDDNTKKQFDDICTEFGMNASVAVNLFAKAVLRERRIPFEISAPEDAHHKWILQQLAESEKEAADPNTKWLTHDEVFGKLREKYGDSDAKL